MISFPNLVYKAFRRDAPTGANWLQRLFCWVIKTRLVSQYSHGGMVIDGELYHITAAGGYQINPPGTWTPAKWDLIPDPDVDVAMAIIRFHDAAAPAIKGWRLWLWKRLKGYDYFGLLAFVGVGIKASFLMYCFELMQYMRTGQEPNYRITPEVLMSTPATV